MSADGLRLVVTTGKRPTEPLVARARAVAAACGLTYVPRDDSLSRLLRRHGADGAYVVTAAAAEVRARGARLAVHPSTARLNVARGRTHPLLRAVAPEAEPPPERVVDATLGQAKDALHLAAVLGCEVVGLERTPLLACLAEDGLARLIAAGEPPWAEAAARIEVINADAHTWLSAQPEASADVVYLDPMFRAPRPAAAGFDLLRALAWPAPLAPALLTQARRVARRRVVLKLPRGERPAPSLAEPSAWTHVPGRELGFWSLAAL